MTPSENQDQKWWLWSWSSQLGPIIAELKGSVVPALKMLAASEHRPQDCGATYKFHVGDHRWNGETFVLESVHFGLIRLILSLSGRVFRAGGRFDERRSQCCGASRSWWRAKPGAPGFKKAPLWCLWVKTEEPTTHANESVVLFQ